MTKFLLDQRVEDINYVNNCLCQVSYECTKQSPNPKKSLRGQKNHGKPLLLRTLALKFLW